MSVLYQYRKEELIMSRQINQEDYYRWTPRNVITKGKFLSIPYINWVEAVITTGLVAYGIYNTNFVMKIKIICWCVICVCVFAAFLHGIKNRSVYSIFFDMIKDRASRTKYSLGGVTSDRKRKAFSTNSEFAGMSLYERAIFNIKSKFKAFDAKYGKEQ